MFSHECHHLLTTCGMFGQVQEFNAAAGIATFDIKWVFTKALDTHFYCPPNILTFPMNALCMFHWHFPSVCMVSTAEYPEVSALSFCIMVYTRKPAQCILHCRPGLH